MRRELSLDSASKALFAASFVLLLIMTAYSINASGGLLSHAASGRLLISGSTNDAVKGAFSYAVYPDEKAQNGKLFDLFAYSTVKLFGANLAFVPLFIFLCCLSGVIYMTLLRKQDGKYLSVTIPIAVFGMLLLSPYLGLNSVFMSVLLVSFIIFCLSFEPKSRNILFWHLIPAISLLWVNMNETGFLAPVICLIFVLFYSAEAAEVYEKQKLYKMKTAWIIFLLVTAVCFLQPGGYKAFFEFYIDIFKQPFHKGHYYGAEKILWYVLFYAYCVFGFVVFLYSTRGHGTDIGRKDTETRDAFLFVILLILAIRNASFIPVFMAASIPFTAYYFFLIFRWDYAWPRKMTEIQLIKLEVPVYIFMAIFFIAASVMMFFIKRPFYPEKSASYILKNPVALNMFVPYQWGSYVEYSLYPAYRVLSSERFGPDASVSREANALENLYEGWSDTVSKYGINSFLLPRRSKLGERLSAEGYLPIYFNDTEIIYINPAVQKGGFKEFNPDLNPGFDLKNAKKAFAEAAAFAENYPAASSISAAARILKSYSLGDAIDYLQDQIETNPGIREIKLELARTYLENGEFENAIETALSFVPPNAESARLIAEARKKLARREEIQ